ncbi:MAG: hypothetical protein HY775_09295 [Acidobacteria bacterium]|nr:hypothetical protein [Acidobacteriota bacterium]
MCAIFRTHTPNLGVGRTCAPGGPDGLPVLLPYDDADDGYVFGLTALAVAEVRIEFRGNPARRVAVVPGGVDLGANFFAAPLDAAARPVWIAALDGTGRVLSRLALRREGRL